MLRAHAAAAEAIRSRCPGSRVGIAHNMLEFAPDRRDSALDRRLARQGERLYNLALLEAIATGRLDWAFPGQGRVRAKLDDLPATHDFIGVNYYSRVHIRFRGVPGSVGGFAYRDPESRGLTDTITSGSGGLSRPSVQSTPTTSRVVVPGPLVGRMCSPCRGTTRRRSRPPC
jgi:beta-glucosidase